MNSRDTLNEMNIQAGPDETLDTLFEGKLPLLQKRHGYRFSMDAVILARCTVAKDRDAIVDLGAGCGVISLILALQTKSKVIVGLEVQSELAELARKNVKINGQESRVRIDETDLRDIKSHYPAETFDVAVSNPPFGIPGTGRINPEPQKAAARHEISATLENVLDAASYLLKQGGRLFIIYPATRLVRLIDGLKRRVLEPKMLRMVHSHRDASAQLAVVQAAKGGGEELVVPNPLYIYERDGGYTQEMAAMYSL